MGIGYLILLIAVPISIGVGQLLFKLASTRLVESDGGLTALFLDPVFIGALALYGGATIVWIYVLKVAPLSYAYSFMALTFVIVPILSRIWLGETLDSRYFVGTVLIILGVVTVQS